MGAYDAYLISALNDMISELPDMPTYDPTTLKAYFDASPIQLKTAFNLLVAKIGTDKDAFDAWKADLEALNMDAGAAAALSAAFVNHNGRHAIGGPDALPPITIGAADLVHVSRHAIGGLDALNALPYDAVSCNLIINGGFDVWQRGTTFAAAGYNADRWTAVFNGSGATRSISQQTFTPGQTDVPNEPNYFLRYNQSVAGSSGTYNTLLQRAEDVRRMAGRKVTLSFYAKASAPVAMGTSVTQGFGSGGSADVVFGSASHSIGTAWAKFTKTISVPSITGKTVGANNYTSFNFDLPLNATFTIDIANVQVNYGEAAIPLITRHYANELMQCKRYYQILQSFNSWVVPNVNNIEIRNAVFSVEMRATPSIVINSQPLLYGTDGTIDRYGSGNISLTGATFTATAAALKQILLNGAFVTTAQYSGSAKLDAEL